MAELSFEELLRRVRTGDPDAAAELVRQYEPEVRRFVRYRLTDPSLRRFLDSLDVCQSVFAELFFHLAAGRLEVAAPWQLARLLLTMAGNKLRDHARRQTALRRGGGRRAEAGEAPEVIADGGPGPAEVAGARDVVETLRARLTDEERGWLDRWMAGFGWDEIASAVGGETHALRKRFARAVDRAARELGWEGPP